MSNKFKCQSLSNTLLSHYSHGTIPLGQLNGLKTLLQELFDHFPIITLSGEGAAVCNYPYLLNRARQVYNPPPPPPTSSLAQEFRLLRPRFYPQRGRHSGHFPQSRVRILCPHYLVAHLYVKICISNISLNLVASLFSLYKINKINQYMVFKEMCLHPPLTFVQRWQLI